MIYKIRPYKQEDIPDMISCWDHSSKIAYPFLTQKFINQERENILNIYLPNFDTWIAEFNMKVIGFISLIDNEIGGIFVSTEFHRKGVGTSLINKAQELYNNLEVEVFANNSIGYNFYLKYGFKVVTEKNTSRNRK